MSRWFRANPIRLAWLFLFATVIVIQARAQFPRLPQVPNIPGPRLPGFGRNPAGRPDLKDRLALKIDAPEIAVDRTPQIPLRLGGVAAVRPVENVIEIAFHPLNIPAHRLI